MTWRDAFFGLVGAVAALAVRKLIEYATDRLED